jgi:uncharacterized membrane protein
MLSMLLSAVGIVFILTAILTQIFKPTKINGLYGYRTPASRRNPQNWRFAQKRSSTLMIIAGAFLIFVGILGDFFRLSENSSAIVGVSIIIATIVAMIYKIETDIKKFEQGGRHTV